MKRVVISTLFACAMVVGTVGCPNKEKSTAPTTKEGNTFVLTKPSDQTIKKGDTDKIKISVDRKGINAPLDVTFSDLPKGVSLVEKEAKIAADQNSAEFTLKADADAPAVVNHQSTVSVKGGGTETSANFNTTVKDK